MVEAKVPQPLGELPHTSHSSLIGGLFKLGFSRSSGMLLLGLKGFGAERL